MIVLSYINNAFLMSTKHKLRFLNPSIYQNVHNLLHPEFQQRDEHLLSSIAIIPQEFLPITNYKIEFHQEPPESRKSTSHNYFVSKIDTIYSSWVNITI